MDKKCERCGTKADGWPGDTGELCQMCWEAVCAEAWWHVIDGQEVENG